MPFSCFLVLPIWMDYCTLETCQQSRRLRDTSYKNDNICIYTCVSFGLLQYVYLSIKTVYTIILSYHSLGRVAPLMSPQIGTPKLRKVAHPSPVGMATHPSRIERQRFTYQSALAFWGRGETELTKNHCHDMISNLLWIGKKHAKDSETAKISKVSVCISVNYWICNISPPWKNSNDVAHFDSNPSSVGGGRLGKSLILSSSKIPSKRSHHQRGQWGAS